MKGPMDVSYPALRLFLRGEWQGLAIAPRNFPLVNPARKLGAARAGARRKSNAGYFFEPTVSAEVSDEARIMNEEPFGPVALVKPISSLEDGVEQASRLPYDLAAYGFTRSVQGAKAMANALQAGMVGVNSFIIPFPETPFPSVKESGHGAENGIEGLETASSASL